MAYAFEALIQDVPEFPKPGIVFKDITPVLADPKAFAEITEAFAKRWAGERLDAIVGAESRGFIFAAALSQAMGVGMGLIRKPGKLPRETHSESYALEYGTDSLEIHQDAFAKGARVLVIDDVLATGGTAAACVELVRRAGGTAVGCAFLMELDFLAGREKLTVPVQSLVHVG